MPAAIPERVLFTSIHNLLKRRQCGRNSRAILDVLYCTFDLVSRRCRRYAEGVTSMLSRMARVNALWSEKPAASAICAIVVLLDANSSQARLRRFCNSQACGVVCNSERNKACKRLTLKQAQRAMVSVDQGWPGSLCTRTSSALRRDVGCGTSSTSVSSSNGVQP